ncbi:glycerol-3-phosphate dehydrogenase subunit GlpB [Spongorhabdus nitratireducens]
MNYDCLVIGGGLAGLTTGIRCAEAGLNVAVISSGESALTFSSGEIDVLGTDLSGRAVQNPFTALESLVQHQPDHPYAHVGTGNVAKSLDWFQREIAEAGLPMVTSGGLWDNHWRLTAAGALRPSWLSQQSAGALPWGLENIQRVVFVSFTGFLDFMPELAAAGLKTHPVFQQAEVQSLNIELPLEHGRGATADTMRAPQLARAIGESDVELICTRLLEQVNDADLVALPACLSAGRKNWLTVLRRRTGLRLVEVATMPPSVPGIRMLSALKRRLTAVGGFMIPAMPVITGDVSYGHVASVQTPDDELHAKQYVLASGSFFSKGLKSHAAGEISEPVFGLDIDVPETLSGQSFLVPEGHGFNRAGVRVNVQLQPSLNGTVIENLHVAGSVLAGYDPVIEGSGGGVAISTGWMAANEVIKKVALP